MESHKSGLKNAYLLGALVITFSLVIIGVSLSYAYFVNTVQEVNPGNKGVSITSGALTMNFATTRSINATAAGLVKEADVLASAEYTAFSVTLPSDGKVQNAQYNLFLTDTKMTNNFKSADLRWALYNGSTKVNEGNFSGVTLSNPVNNVYSAADIPLLNNVSISKGTTTSYKLYVWLNYDATAQQNSLLQGSLSTKVGFRAVSK